MARTPPARTAGQRPLLAGVALVVLVLGGNAVLQAGTPGEQEAPAAAASQPASPSPEPGRSAEVVGPVRGADVAAYVDDRTTALLEAPATVDTAVVSFQDVLTVEDALAVVGDGGEVRAVLVRLPLEQASASTVRVGPGDDVVAAVTAAVAVRVEELRTERAAAQELLDSGTVEDDEFVEEYRRRVEELDRAIGAVEAGRVVHAVVVRASLAQLQALVDEVGVRLVDPAPPGTDVASSTFSGLLPGDTETVSEGRAG